MADVIRLQNTTIAIGLTAEQQFLLSEINDKLVGFPIFTFTWTEPDMDLVQLKPYSDFTMSKYSAYDTATSYGGVGLAVTLNGSAVALPLFKVEQNSNVYTNFRVMNPTLVFNLTSTGTFMLVDLENTLYGIPIYEYSGEFGNETAPSSAISVKSTLLTNLIQDVDPDAGSTNLNSKISTYSSLILRIKRVLGYPNINVNICDENIVEYIDQAMEYYTKYAGYTEEFLMFHSALYQRGCGIKLDNLFSVTPEMRNTCYTEGSAAYDYDLGDYRKVIDVHSFEQGEGVGINTLFTLEQAMVQQTYFGYMLGNTGFDLITWEVLKGWLDTRKKVLAQIPYIRFDPKTQIMKIIPEPYEGQNYYGVVACYVERPIKHLISEPWVVEYATALTLIGLGRIYGKFTGMTLPIGGGSINYESPLQYGLKRKEELEKELYTGYGFAETPPPAFFIG